ncbi:hypothetical protein HN419_04155 [Candidatus Woesearchaeota archaeon]|mgnify:CR=1 FL=1|jgi:DNA-directed RNA polymerase subunit RPC12/RpoP|nr:hypothetical protein [Candidatus Woesearchaeota archaeon]MBT3537930.1 hypothetical protein [Candidatus Woesearchaeota archaeon]MBT4698068.1 hypothetical protein [Candidatus Woesearchaeota archaeon]MBT4716519.1 hypothetical protein [Candidatus Woesearchaeota archaeon]MBT7105599.1 hypothetical protein [Candidatus Woesearchaeota archaeon]
MGDTYREVIVVCTKCGLDLPITHMQLDSRSEALVCKNCLDNPGSKITKISDDPIPVRKKPNPLVKDVDRVGEKEPKPEPEYPVFNKPNIEPFIRSVEEEKLKYKCINCGFVMLRREDSPVKRCPYCDQPSLRLMQNK